MLEAFGYISITAGLIIDHVTSQLLIM